MLIVYPEEKMLYQIFSPWNHISLRHRFSKYIGFNTAVKIAFEFFVYFWFSAKLQASALYGHALSRLILLLLYYSLIQTEEDWSTVLTLLLIWHGVQEAQQLLGDLRHHNSE